MTLNESKRKNKMKLERLKDILEAEVLWGEDYLHTEIKTAFGSDLLSDVLAFAKAGSMLLTSLINPQVIRTAEMVDISAIFFVSGKKPEKPAIGLAKDMKIPLLCTLFPMYESCGKLYKNGLHGYSEAQE